MRWVKGISRELLLAAFREWFGVQTNQADLLVTLYEQNGRPLSCKRIGTMVSSHRPLSPNAVWERVRVLRAAMESEAIDSDERGYRLTETGMEECRLALRRAAETFVRYGFELPPVEAVIAVEFGPGTPDAARKLEAIGAASSPTLRLTAEGAE